MQNNIIINLKRGLLRNKLNETVCMKPCCYLTLIIAALNVWRGIGYRVSDNDICHEAVWIWKFLFHELQKQYHNTWRSANPSRLVWFVMGIELACPTAWRYNHMHATWRDFLGDIGRGSSKIKIKKQEQVILKWDCPSNVNLTKMQFFGESSTRFDLLGSHQEDVAMHSNFKNSDKLTVMKILKITRPADVWKKWIINKSGFWIK